jgi:outer membrane protein TolC
VRERLLPALAVLCVLSGGVPHARAQAESSPGPIAPAEATLERATFAEAVERATKRNPTVGEAAQAILRAQALLDQARSVFRPLLTGSIGTVVLDAARGFGDSIFQPRTQTAFNATVSYAVLDTARWAAKNQAADQLAISRISAEETRRQVALAAAQSYLAVIAAQRQREIAIRNLETARALEEYARSRLEAGKGSRLNHVRSMRELAGAEGQLELTELLLRRAQEALGVAIFADGPVDASGDPDLEPAAPASNDAWLMQRPDVRLFDAEVRAAERVVRDTWTSWFPTGTASFTPQYVTPPGLVQPAKTWRAVFQLQIPIYDATLAPDKRVKVADREAARFRLDGVKVQARAEVRVAQESVTRTEHIVATTRRAAESAAEALRITEVAYRAGASSNIEVVQAQQTARNAEIEEALAEDRLRQARLDLLAALGRFP